MESECADALALSARAIQASVRIVPKNTLRKDVPHHSESKPFESNSPHLYRVGESPKRKKSVPPDRHVKKQLAPRGPHRRRPCRSFRQQSQRLCAPIRRRPVVRFQHSQGLAAGFIANVGIKGPTANMAFSRSFGFDIRFASPRLGGSRMSNPLRKRTRRDILEVARQARL